ncbi:MAG: RecQ family ATP-dependent DNA helicase [Planctomycetota bacterium]|jgi:ATP-dependent DNA helicase RecQ
MRTNLPRALKQHFGFDSFRGPQQEIVRGLLAGKSALVVMATGEGKSLCYQLPGLILDGLTLVVSPLIALMEDQTMALRAKGIAATCIHSMLDRQTRRQRLQDALAGKVKLLYVTPERFHVGTFLAEIQRVKIPLMAVDEAHCVSHWGHDFRPHYRRLGEARAALGMPTCLALTATATPNVQQDIKDVLQMPEAELFHTGIERENLFLGVHEVHTKEDKVARVLHVMDEIGGPGIVYTALIRDLLELEDHLRRRGFDPIVYHGKLSANERREQQARFIQSRDDVILATNAFGMGVDKPDIRFIQHYQVPGTLEAYYQEIGRAGRDGIGSYCELVYLEEDVTIQRNFTEWSNPSRELMQQVVQHLMGMGERLNSIDMDDLRDTFLIKNRGDGRVETCLRLLHTAGCVTGDLGADLAWVRTPSVEEVHEWLPADKRKRDLMALLEMVKYAREEGCRKQLIEAYFGFPLAAKNCGACDTCRDRARWLTARLPRKKRRAIQRQRPSVSSGKGSHASKKGTDKDEVSRGDWIKVKGHGLCAVKRVHKTRNGLTVDVEVARDLEARTLDLRRVRWEKVES